MTLPFQLPISDSKCLASGSGWNLIHTFHAYIYIPVAVFIATYYVAKKHPAKSPSRVKAASTLLFLVTLWYTPLLKTIASIFECVTDAKGDWVIKVDPTVSCEVSISRRIMQAQG